MISRPIIYPKAYSDFFRPLLNTAGSSWRRCGAQDHRLHRPCACGNLRGIEVPARICQVLMSSDFFNHDMNCCYGCYRQWSVEDGDGIQDRNDLSRIFRQVRFHHTTSTTTTSSTATTTTTTATPRNNTSHTSKPHGCCWW